MHGSAGARTSKLDANGWPRRAVAAGAQFGDIIANHVVVSQIVLLKRAIGEGGHQECVGEGKRTVQCLVSWRRVVYTLTGCRFLMCLMCLFLLQLEKQ